MKALLLLTAIATSIATLPALAKPHAIEPTNSRGFFTADVTRLTPQNFENMIQEEMMRLDKIAGFETPVKLTDEAISSAEPDNVIYISRPELIQLQQRVQGQQFRQVLRFLLAHEKTHEIQYRLYSVSAVRANDSERRRLYEAQADLLAGKYLVETLGEPKPEDLVAIIDTLKLAFDLGTLEFSALDHPSKEQRRTAARLGMASGMITTLSGLRPTPALGEIIGSLAQKVDFLRDETVMDWSYRVAKRIIRYSRTPGQYILLKDSKIDWDKRATSPFVTFSLTYENTGERPIHVDMEVQCASVARDDPDDTLEWLKWSVKNFRFDLQPGQRYVATGRLQWYATEKLMPRLVFPPRSTALISTEYVR